MAKVDWNAMDDSRLAPMRRIFERVAGAAMERRCPICGEAPFVIKCDGEVWLFCPVDRVKDRIGVYPALSVGPAVKEEAQAMAREILDPCADAEFPLVDEQAR
jgi:hypothetical protein